MERPGEEYRVRVVYLSEPWLGGVELRLTDEKHLDQWRKMVRPIKATMKAYCLVAISKDGEPFWGAEFGEEPEKLLHYVRIVQHDARAYAKKYGGV
jgi:hypothetical protein